jgi:hypothetical protein
MTKINKWVMISTILIFFILLLWLILTPKTNNQIFVEQGPEVSSKQEQPQPVFEDLLNDKLNEENTDILPKSYSIQLPRHFYQTFNNCGPATLAMILNYYGINVDQKDLGLKLRPFQNPQGDNDDKHVGLDEMAYEAELKGFNTLYLPNGDIELIKKFIYKDIPVITVTWLNNKEDIGHYRAVRGYNDNLGILIQDDSYQGPNKEYKYQDFLDLWQPFNYKYLVVYPKDKQSIVEKIVGEENEPDVVWANALERAKKETLEQPDNAYPLFNQSVAQYYLGNFQESVDIYEDTKNELPGRMLWYQYEPIQAYVELKEYSTALGLIENILNNNNKAYSELYLERGNIYLAQGDKTKALTEYEKALNYNKNYRDAQLAIDKLDKN